jgi:hypothetical protein
LLARYKKGEFRRAGGPVEKALAASADADTLLAMVEVKGPQGITHTHYLHGAVEAVVLEHRPLGGNSYEIHGVNAEKLRKALFAKIDAPSGELTKACLVRIESCATSMGASSSSPGIPTSERAGRGRWKRRRTEPAYIASRMPSRARSA